MKEKFKQAHLNASGVYARLSHCKRRKVGCVIVKDDQIISFGYNGTPAGEDNCCEDENYITKPNVLHAERNAILKLDPADCEGASLFVTVSPCKECGELIIERKFKDVYYHTRKNTNLGLQIMEECGIVVQQLPNEDENGKA